MCKSVKRDNGIILKQFARHNNKIDFISFSHDSTKFACISTKEEESTDDKIILWDLLKNDQPFVINSFGNVFSMKWSLYDNTFSTIYNDNTITVWDLETGENLHQIGGNTNSNIKCRWSPDHSMISTITENSILYIQSKNI